MIKLKRSILAEWQSSRPENTMNDYCAKQPLKKLSESSESTFRALSDKILRRERKWLFPEFRRSFFNIVRIERLKALYFKKS